jgi:hypothetical protein
MNVSIENGMATSTPRTCSNSSNKMPNLKANEFLVKNGVNKKEINQHALHNCNYSSEASRVLKRNSKNMEKTIIKVISDYNKNSYFIDSNRSIDSNKNKTSTFCVLYPSLMTSKISFWF